MLSSTVVLMAASLASFALAQNQTATNGAPYPYLVDPNDPAYKPSDRANACDSQLVACRNICPDGAYPNTCDPTTLTYLCVCGDGSMPNVTAYENTLPFFECLQFKSECVQKTNDPDKQKACNDIQCGVLGDPAAARQSSSTALPSATPSQATPTGNGAATPTTAAASGPAPSTAAAVALGKTFGTGAIMAGALGAFGLLL